MANPTRLRRRRPPLPAAPTRHGDPMTDCPFCARIHAGDYDPIGRGLVGFEPLNPVTPGHYLLVPSRHVTSMLASPATFARTALHAAQVARVRARRGIADDWNIISSAGPSATQTVRHLHVHLIPRRPDDGLTLPWSGQYCTCPAPQTLRLAGQPLRCGHCSRLIPETVSSPT